MQVYELPFAVDSFWNLECHSNLLMSKCNFSPVYSSEYKPHTEYTSVWESLQEFTNEFYVHVSQVKHCTNHCSNAEYAVLVTPSIRI